MSKIPMFPNKFAILASILGVSGKTTVGISRNNSQVLAGCGATTIIAVQSSVIMSFNGFVAFCAYGTGARIIGDVANSSGAKDTSEKINFYLDTDGKCYVQNLAFDNFSFTYKIIA